eukprot:COSAG02_NODE_1053_length_14943_cov_3.871076_10_plen_57_part_00
MCPSRLRRSTQVEMSDHVERLNSKDPRLCGNCSGPSIEEKVQHSLRCYVLCQRTTA